MIYQQGGRLELPRGIVEEVSGLFGSINASVDPATGTLLLKLETKPLPGKPKA